MSLLKRDKEFMRRCIELAGLGLGKTAPNPLVGSVIVHHDTIIGEGYHRMFGEAHAEVNAIQSVKDKSLLKESVLYVNLEPCAHMGKTPPCSDLIISHHIPEVIIGTTDPNSLVKGKGIKKMQDASIRVTTGILGDACRELNKRFFTYHEKKRPYIIFKWAESADGYIDIKRTPESPIAPYWISNIHSRRLVHRWRSEEQAIMVGTNTVLYDNPRLDQRMWKGKSPVRVVLDRTGRIPSDAHVLNGKVKTFLFTESGERNIPNTEIIVTTFDDQILTKVLEVLFRNEIQSLIVEGGSQLITSFYQQNLWDEARIFKGTKLFKEGVKAPLIHSVPVLHHSILKDSLYFYKNV